MPESTIVRTPEELRQTLIRLGVHTTACVFIEFATSTPSGPADISFRAGNGQRRELTWDRESLSFETVHTVITELTGLPRQPTGMARKMTTIRYSQT